MVLRAREIMTDRVVSVWAETPLEAACALLTENRFSALPVVDRYQRLIGIVSAADVIAGCAPATGLRQPATVGAVMSRDVLHMTPDADVGIVAHRLRTYGGLRVMPIVDHGVLVGIVTRADLLRPRPRGGKLGRLAQRLIGRGRRSAPPEGRLWPAGTPRGGHPPPQERAREDRPAVVAAVLAREVMTASGLVTVTETTPTERAAELLTAHRFTALPVLGDSGRLVGVVSEADLVRDPLDGRRGPPARTVDAAMTSDVTTAGPDTTMAELARMLSVGGLRVVPIVEDRRLVGMVSRGDLLRPVRR
jgi:CBS domain-containing protein